MNNNLVPYSNFFKLNIPIKIMKNTINVILIILAMIGVGFHIVGNVLDDKSYWIISDVYSSVVFLLVAYRLYRLRSGTT